MEENIDILIQKIQEARSPKYFLWQVIKNVEWFASTVYNDTLLGKKDRYVYFNYNKKNHTLYYDFYKIYQILSSKYHLNEQEISELVGSMVSEHFKLRVDTTWSKSDASSTMVSEHFKLRVDTTQPDITHKRFW